MLFIDPAFVFIFLPLCAGVFYSLRAWAGRTGALALGSLTLFSIAFYAYWSLAFTWVLLGSVAFNYALAIWMVGRRTPRARKALLIAGIAGNLTLLGVFKYAGFIAGSLNAATGLDLTVSIVLPIGISFYTFQQIAYLADAYRDGFAYRNVISYALFVSFFPQLIAGPIVHHREMMPQFLQPGRLRVGGLVAGVTQFTIGLVKKVVIADTMATFSTPYFAAAEQNPELALSPALAWTAALAFTLQIYFDFSGYSDMAIGLGRLFGIRLPVNFNSPYGATSIIEFWRRWHMTLSRFLRDYLYIPLGGNRRGTLRRYLNIMITMLLGGLWHGAGWTFVIWGGLHGMFLVVNHLWRRLVPAPGRTGPRRLAASAGWLVTFLLVTHAWVIFRADSIGSAVSIVGSMWGLAGGEVAGTAAAAPLLQVGGARETYALADYAAFFPYFAIPALFLATRRLNANFISVLWARRLLKGALPARILWTAAILVGFYLSMVLVTYSQTEFLYFRF